MIGAGDWEIQVWFTRSIHWMFHPSATPCRCQQSLLLDEQEGCAAFLQAIQGLCSAEQTCTPALYAFREKAVNLLFLEQDAYRHFSQNEQVNDVE